MRHKILIHIAFLFATIILNTRCVNVNSQNVTQTLVTNKNNDSTTPDLQKAINKNTSILDLYYTQFQKLGKHELSELLPIKKTLNDSIAIIEKRLTELNKKNDTTKIATDSSILKSKTTIAFEITKLQKIKEIISLKVSMIQEFENVTQSKYLPAIKNLQKQSTLVTGLQYFTFKNELYKAYIVDLKKQDIRMYLYDSAKQNFYTSIGNLLNTLKQTRQDVEMVTNGGMYHPNQMPTGLYIANQKTLTNLDTLGPGNVNFNMLPNGVFYLLQGEAFVDATNEYLSKTRKANFKPTFATQSGPMLVVNGKHHPNFNFGSSSKKLRSGVGIMANGKVVFIISVNHNITFFDFATIFKDIFGCKNALFLDGEISKMYCKNAQNSNDELDGFLSSMIVVTNK